jgi:hypothetical protein
MKRVKQARASIARTSINDLIISKHSSTLTYKILKLLSKDWVQTLKYLRERTIKRLFFEGRDCYLNDPITFKTKFILDDRGDGLTLKDRSIMIVPEDFEDFDHAKQPNKDYYSYFSSISSSIDVSGRLL